jgi:hypothetical protein
VWPGLVSGLKVPLHLSSPSRVHDGENPRDALAIGTYLFLTYGDLVTKSSLERDGKEDERTEEDSVDKEGERDVDGDESDSYGRQLMLDGHDAVYQIKSITTFFNEMRSAAKETKAMLLNQCLVGRGDGRRQQQRRRLLQHNPAQVLESPAHGTVQEDGGDSRGGGASSTATTSASESITSDSVSSSSFASLKEEENNNGEDIQSSHLKHAGVGEEQNDRYDDEKEKEEDDDDEREDMEKAHLRRLLSVKESVLREIYKFNENEDHSVNVVLSAASTTLCQVFRQYAARSQGTTGASVMAKKDFVTMSKDSHLIEVSDKKSKVLGESSREALAAMKIQAIARGKQDRELVKTLKREDDDTMTDSSSSKRKRKQNKKKSSSGRRTSMRLQIISGKTYGKKHAERVFDQASNGALGLDLAQFAEALIRLGVLRFVTNIDSTMRHTIDERATLVVDAVCRYAKRSDIKAFRNSVLTQPSVSRIIRMHQSSIQSAFVECCNLEARGKRGGGGPSKSKSGPSGKNFRRSSFDSNEEVTTTLIQFEQWLEMIGKGESRGGHAYNIRGKAWHKLSGIGKKTAREIFGHVQRLDWHDGTVSTLDDDLEMTLDEFQEGLVAVALYVDPDPFRAMDQRVETGLEKILGLDDE